MSWRPQEAYLAAVKGLAQHYRQRPDALRAQQVEGYIGYLIEPRHLAPNRVRIAVCGLRVVYPVTLQRQPLALPLPKGVQQLPAVLSRDEGGWRLSRTATVRERARLMTTDGGGVRVRAVVHRRVSDIDAQRDRLRVEPGKGRKDRYPRLGSRLRAELRHYWQV